MKRRLTREDSGLSLSELLVTMMIVSVVLVLAASALVATTQQFRVTSGKVDTQSDSRTAMESITRDLRVVVPNPAGGGGIESGDGNTVTFYTARDASQSRPQRVTYSVDPSSRCLRKSEIAPVVSGGNVTYPGANTKSRCIGFSRVDTSQPLFTYQTLQVDGTTGIAASATDPKIGSVEVRLQLTSPDRPEVAPTTVTRTVTLINQTNTILRG